MEKNCTVENCKQLNKRNEKNLHLKYPASKIVSFIILTLFCIVWIAPFVLLVTVSLRNQNDAMLYPEQFLYPHSGYSFESYRVILFGETTGEQHITTGVDYVNLLCWILNSCGSAIGGTILYLLVASLTAYAFTFSIRSALSNRNSTFALSFSYSSETSFATITGS